MAVVFVLLALPATVGAATITIQNADSPGEGFNDPSPRAPVLGNPGATLGQQRLNLFQAAANVWGAILRSNITIVVRAQFNPLVPCEPGFAVLGSANAETYFRDFAGAPLAGTWYAVAAANSRFNGDLDPGVQDINAQFNSTIDLGGSCLGGQVWSYIIGGPPAAGTLNLFDTVLHEIAHGLGFATVYNYNDGSMPQGFPDAYLRNLYDVNTAPNNWHLMSDAQRFASQIDTGNLAWNGTNGNARTGAFTAGVNGSRMRMYAPNPHQPGSSVSHWDTALTPNELQEPTLTNNAEDYITWRMMLDVGWLENIVFKDAFESGNRNFWTLTTPP
jgi:hypothetical protein